jgi:two-component sensor histidine kinase
MKNSYVQDDFIVALLLLIILFGILVLLYRLQSKKKTICVLMNKNLELQTTCKEYSNLLTKKDLLLKEIHHRVKNNLQLIISLLSIDLQKQANYNLQGVLKKIESRIVAMSIIHHKLCEEEKFIKLNFQDYLENLIENIKECYHVENNISFTINSKNIFFDIDTAIPLGLIINELTCNTIKYAFNKNQQGNIKIIIKKRNEFNYSLFIGDNGIGIKKTEQINKSIGLDLVRLLVVQLNGEIKTLQLKGTNYLINFYEIKTDIK